jgi:hypothetical protein
MVDGPCHADVSPVFRAGKLAATAQVALMKPGGDIATAGSRGSASKEIDNAEGLTANSRSNLQRY